MELHPASIRHKRIQCVEVESAPDVKEAHKGRTGECAVTDAVPGLGSPKYVTVGCEVTRLQSC